MENKKGFTLIEMMIVIVIIAILLTLSMWISADRIHILKTKSVQEQMIYNYNNLFSKNMLTNYYEGSMYENMIIKMEKDSEQFSYGYKSFAEEESAIQFSQDRVEGGHYTFKQLKLDGNNKNNITIKFTPYVLGCEISDGNNTGGHLKVQLEINNNKQYCFQISSNLCKQEAIPCE